jgi:hypothetical protein
MAETVSTGINCYSSVPFEGAPDNSCDPKPTTEAASTRTTASRTTRRGLLHTTERLRREIAGQSVRRVPRPLDQMPQLSMLNRSNNQIKNSPPLDQMLRLSKLNQSNNQIKNSPPLDQMPQLSKLNRSNNQIGRAAFPSHPALKEIRLSNTQLESPSLESPTQAIDEARADNGGGQRE